MKKVFCPECGGERFAVLKEEGHLMLICANCLTEIDFKIKNDGGG